VPIKFDLQEPASPMNKIKNIKSIKSPLFITGHTGFKGSWLTALLDSLEIPYIGVSLEPSPDSLYNELDRPFLVKEYFQDIRDFAAVRKIIEIHRPEMVLHLAAQPLVLDSYKDPLGTFATNVMGTANILESLRTLGSTVFVGVVTTDKVYKNDNRIHKFVETDPIMGTDPYSSSKAASENVVSAWRSMPTIESNLIISSLRAGNVIGGGDLSSNRLLPDLIRNFSTGEQPVIRNPEAVRPWQHVLDPLIGYLLALNYSMETNQHNDFNFGPNDAALNVGQVAEIACKAWGANQMPLIQRIPDAPYEAGNLDLSSDKARSMLKWEPIWSQRDAVVRTVNWWKSHSEGNAKSCCDEDLKIALQFFK
jgi:CDP-glucose 4,6-dehydratase